MKKMSINQDLNQRQFEKYNAPTSELKKEQEPIEQVSAPHEDKTGYR